uniref:Uncharacterized protein n=1 Tax=Plectus sambesii TaxID=2011161 RepID=A0A914UIT9_9BILA
MANLSKRSNVVFKFFDFECDVVDGVKLFLSLYTLTRLLIIAVAIRYQYHWLSWTADLLLLTVILISTLLAFTMKNPSLLWPFILVSGVGFALSLGILLIYMFLIAVIIFVPESEPQLHKIIGLFDEKGALPLLWICLACIGTLLLFIAIFQALQLIVVIQCHAFFKSLLPDCYVNRKLNRWSSTAYKLPRSVPIDINTSASVNVPMGFYI